MGEKNDAQPAALPPLTVPQLLFLDGIRYSSQMVMLAYARLHALLASLSDGGRTPTPEEFTAATLDAWSIIDSSFRLRHLVTSIPGVKQQAPPIRLYQQRTQAVEDLRHFIQHVNNEVQALTNRQHPFWGSIAWYRAYDPSFGRICSLKIGAFRENEEVPLINPAGKVVRPPIDLVTLNAAGFTVNLSEVAKAVAEVNSAVRDELGKRFNLSAPGTMADALMTLDLHVGTSGVQQV